MDPKDDPKEALLDRRAVGRRTEEEEEAETVDALDDRLDALLGVDPFFRVADALVADK